MKIFISYRRADSKYVVDRIRERLISVYAEDSVFRDIESIPPGENFSNILTQATQGCDVMLVIIGPQWVSVTDAKGNKRLNNPNDYTRIEVETGLANKDILVIPVLVMDAMMPLAQEIPESLSDLLFRNAISVRNDPDFDHDMQRLIQGINQAKGGSITLPVQYFEPETVYIPPGPFLMGSEAGSGIPSHETPQHEVTLPAYRIGMYPVTNKQFEGFVLDTHRSVAPEMGWEGLKVPAGSEKLPVAGVTWYDAMDYCQWLSEKTARKYSLPNEAQWEKACRGGKQSTYPWGEDFDPERCNHGKPTLAPVDAYPAQNEYGCFDLVGNVRQWTTTLWGGKLIAPDPKYAYPWKEDGRNDINASRQVRRVMRGSSTQEDVFLLRCSARSGQYPDNIGPRNGFRIVMSV